MLKQDGVAHVKRTCVCTEHGTYMLKRTSMLYNGKQFRIQILNARMCKKVHFSLILVSYPLSLQHPFINACIYRGKLSQQDIFCNRFSCFMLEKSVLSKFT